MKLSKTSTRMEEIVNIQDFLSLFKALIPRTCFIEDCKKNFETFLFLYYKNDSCLIPPEVLQETEIDTPLKLYKYLLMKAYLPIISNNHFGNNDVFQKIQEQFKDSKQKYMDSLRKGIAMNAEENRYVKSAIATFQLAEVALKIQSNEFDFEKYDFLKLKKQIFDLFNSYNAGSEATVQYLYAIVGKLFKNRDFQTAHAILCVMTEIIKMTRVVRGRVGLMTQLMRNFLTEVALNNEIAKIYCLFNLLRNATIEPDQGFELIKKDEENAKILMELFENDGENDEFRNIPMKVEDKDHAEVLYELILRLTRRHENRSETHAKEVAYYRASAIGYLAAFETDQAEIHRLCERSLRMLEGLRNEDPSDFDSREEATETFELNLRRMWKMKLEIYNQEKSLENLIALRNIAEKRIFWGKFMILLSEKYTFLIKHWRIFLDLAECALLVYGDYSCFSKFAKSAYNCLEKTEFGAMEFEKATGIPLELSMERQEFVKALADKLKPYDKKIKNAFEDDSAYENFDAFYYNTPNEKVLAKTNLNTPLNIYKYMLVMLTFPVKTNEKFTKTAACHMMLNKIEVIEQKYKEFLDQDISMTSKEQKYVRTAYDSVRLAKITMNLEIDRQNCEDLCDFNFQEFREICSAFLNCFVGEIPIIYLLLIYDAMMDQLFSEVARFISSLMTDILQKSRVFRAEIDAMKYCACISNVPTTINFKVNYAQLSFLDRFLRISSIVFIISRKPPRSRNAKDRDMGKMLMELFENYEGDNAVFHEIPLRAENYEQARIMYEMILKLTKERREILKLAKYDDTELFEALALSSYSNFLEDWDEAYRLSELSTESLKKCLKNNDRDVKKHELGYQIGAIDQNLTRMWRIKLAIYKEDRCLDNKIKMKKIAQERIHWGQLISRSNFDLPFEDWWVNWDMLSCHIEVFADYHNAKICAESIWYHLLYNTDEIPAFNKSIGINFSRNMNKQKFIKILALKYK